jgi:type III secretion system YscQ/HrcQ family protein
VTPKARPRVRPYPFSELARVARAQVDAGRVLLRFLPLEPGASFADVERLFGGPMRLEVVDAGAHPARALAAGAHGALVKLAAPGGRWALVEAEPRLVIRLAQRLLGLDENEELAAPRPLTPAEEGVFELVMATLTEGQPLRVEGVIGQAEAAALLEGVRADGWLLTLEARIETPAGGGWGRLYAPDALRLALPPPRAGAAWFARRERLAEARVDLRLELGRAALRRDELAALEVHDVVVLARTAVRDVSGGPVLLGLGRGAFAARLEGQALTISEPFRLTPGATMIEEPEEKAEGGETLLGELPVELVCELGRVTMTGRELIELRPGAVIPVGRPLSGPVDLTVGGRVVARGELVDVEGEMGVRVTQLND